MTESMNEAQRQSADADGGAPAADSSRLLAEAIRALTAAARLTHQPLRRAADGGWEPDPDGPAQQHDWAEFVTLALAGAAANFGGVEAILAGRSGSWEAARVRDVLTSTVGEDDAHLWEHRTEPLRITLYLDELLNDFAPQVWRQYDAAEKQLNDRYNAIGIPSFNSTPGMSEAEVEAGLSGLQPATAEQEDAAEAIGELEERLEAQRLQEARDYGEALRAKILVAAAAVPGLTVPVEVLVDVDTYRSPPPYDETSLEARLVNSAVMDTPTPDDLPGTPLERLEGRP